MLPKLEGYAAARLGSLDAAALATVTGELASLEQTVLVAPTSEPYLPIRQSPARRAD